MEGDGAAARRIGTVAPFAMLDKELIIVQAEPQGHGFPRQLWIDFVPHACDADPCVHRHLACFRFTRKGAKPLPAAHLAQALWRQMLDPVLHTRMRRRAMRAVVVAQQVVEEPGIGLGAVAQKSACEKIRVIMGKESPLKLSQRGPDAREEVPMRTPKRLYAEERIIYQPELLTCLHCGDLLVPWNYLAWDKTVQTLDGLLSIATRPGRCPHATCPGSRMRLLSAVAQRMAPPGSTYGYDVLVRIGWLRQHQRATYSEIHTELSCRFSISESHVRYLYQHVYLPLLACHERQQRGRLAQVAQEQGGLVVALDGLAPRGGEPQIWFIRDLSTGLTLRSGWLAHLDQPTFEAFLAPLRHLEWPI